MYIGSIVLIGKEYLLDLFAENVRDPESEGETRVVFFRLDGVDGLARDVEFVGQVRL